MINYPKVKDSIMKQIIRNILFLALILLSSCELSMLEYELPEDQRGKGEPYTEVNEYGEFTYEYNKNVTPLNGDPQNYIATMNDSVLWFMDNMPDKWVPKAGEYIAANCSKTIPLGLCAKVRSVTRENGMIRVEHEPATREEVFKQLKVRLDFDYVAPGIEKTMGDSTVETRSAQSIDRPGFWKNDSTFVDMSLYDVETRAASDYLEKEKGSEFSFFTPIPMGDEYLLVQFTYGSKEIIRIHEREDLLAEYHEEWNDRYTERKFKLLASISKDKDQKSLRKKYPAQYDEIQRLKLLFNDENVKKSLKAYNKLLDEGPDGRTIPISIPSCPISAVLRFELKYGFTLSAYGYVEAKYVSEAHRVGVIVNKGEKTQIDKKVDIWRGDVQPGFHWGDMRVGGSFDVWARVRAGVGVIVGQGAGIGGVVGFEFKGGFRASLETDQMTPIIKQAKNEFTAGCYIAFGGYFEGIGVFGPWTITLHDFNFMVREIPVMFDLGAKVNRYKTRTNMDVYNVVDEETGDKKGQEFCIETDLYFDKLETFFAFGGLESSSRRPALRIYEGTKPFMGRKVHQVVLDKVLEAEKNYKFNVNLTKAGLHSDENDFLVIPCIYDTSSGIITEYRDNAMKASSEEPFFIMPAMIQAYGIDISEINWETYLSIYDELQGKNREDFAEYCFSAIVAVKNASKVKEWGIIVELYAGAKLIKKQKIPHPFEGVCPSGDFTFVLSFISQYKTPLDDDGNVGLSAYATTYAYYEGDEKAHEWKSKCLYFRYPYSDASYIPSLGEEIHQLL